MENYSLSDLAAVTGGNGIGGFGGGAGLLILIVLFMLFGGGAWGNRGGDWGQYATAASQQEILFGQQFQNLDNKIDRIGNGIADATFALNNNILSEGRNTQMQIATTHCEDIKNVDSVRYDMANFAAATNANTTAQIQKVLDALAQNKIESLQGQVNQLQLQAAMCGVVRYPNAMTYNAGNSPFCNCNCNCGAI